MENELKVFYCPCADCEDCEYFISDNNGFYGEDPEVKQAVVDFLAARV